MNLKKTVISLAMSTVLFSLATYQVNATTITTTKLPTTYQTYSIPISMFQYPYIIIPTTAKPATTTQTVAKPATTTQTVAKPATTTQTVAKPATTTQTVAKPATTTQTVAKPATTTQTVAKPATTTQTVAKPATTTQTVTKPATTTQTVAKPAITTRTVANPVATTQATTAAPITIIRYGTSWCPNCQNEDKVLRKMQAEYGSSLNVQFVDIEDPANKAIVSQYNIKGIPFVTILNSKNQQVDSFVGYHDENSITSILKKDGLLK